METLVLSNAYLPIRRTSWQEAISLVFKGFAEIVHTYEDRKVRTVTMEFKMPSVIRYLRYKNPKKNVVRFSRENIYTRDRGICQYCGDKCKREKFTYDHVIPRAKGGQTTWENVVVSCYPCNQKKRDRTVGEAGMRLLSTPVKPTSMPLTAKLTLRYEKSMPEDWKNYLPTLEYWYGELENDNPN